MDSDDCAQEAAIEAWLAQKRYDATRGRETTFYWRVACGGVARAVKQQERQHLATAKLTRTRLSSIAIRPESPLPSRSANDLPLANFRKAERRCVQLWLDGHTFAEIGCRLRHTAGWAEWVVGRAVLATKVTAQ